MSSCSSGVDYAHLVKPIIEASFGAAAGVAVKQDVIDFIKSINKCKEEIINYDEENKPFFTAFCPLAADFLARNTSCITIGNLNSAVNAAKILMEYLARQIGTTAVSYPILGVVIEDLQTDTNSENVTTQSQILSNSEKEKIFVLEDKYLLAGLRALCSAGSLHRPEQLSLLEAMKSVNLPSFIKTTTSDRDSTRDTRRIRNDPSALILEQLVSPLQDLNNRIRVRDSTPLATSGEKEDNLNIAENTDNALYINNLFSCRCESAFQSLGRGNIMIDTCLNLQTIQKYTQKYKELLEGKGHGFPLTVAEALALKPSMSLMVQELHTVWRIFTLPILEPLSPSRLEKLSTIAMAVLLASLHVAMTVGIITVSTQGASMSKTPPPRDEDIDTISPSITEKSLDLFNVLLNAVRLSTRAGGHHVQNLQLMGSWLLMTGLHQLMLNLSTLSVFGQDKKEDKGKSPSKKDGSATGRLNLNKVQQGFGVVCVALASQGITLLTGLMEDVKVEGLASANIPEPARLDPLESYSAIERLARIFNSVPLNQVLFYMAIVSYRKSCSLKRNQRALHEGDTFSISDSTTFYEDDFSEASLGDEDDDSVIIGSWFEESAPVGDEVAENCAQSSSSNPSSNVNSQAKNNRPNSEVTTLVPEKGEPHGFISLSSHIFLLMNNYLVENECLYVQQYVRSGLGEMHMIMLAAIIRDIDKETSKTESGSMTTYLGPVLGSLYDEFSYSLYRYTHNIIASEYLNENLQITLLTQLGVSPWATEGDWPLQVLPRTLSLLAQILLLRQRKDKDELKCDSDAACVLIWQRVINTLVKYINNPSSSESDNDDLNVEHAQLLLFLFHSLQLMQKKSVLISVGSALVSVSPVIKTTMKDMQLMHFSRLLLILDYLMKNLYEAPQSLIDQVQWNLFKPMSSDLGQGIKNEYYIDSSSGKLYHTWKTLEDNYRKYCIDDNAIKPCFYTLTPIDKNFHETPKLDGLACSFILATPDNLKYSVFYETIISLLNIGCQLDPSLRSLDQKLSFFGLCSLEYTFNIAYRTFLTLPPAVTGLDALVAPDIPMDGPLLLHQIMWGPRTTHKVFVEWIKDGLVRQSLTTQRADSLLKTVSNSVCGLTQDVKLANKMVKSYLQKGFSQEPAFSDLFVLDAVLARLHVTFDAACQKGEIDSRSAENIDLFQAVKLSSDQIIMTELLTLVRSLTKSIRCSLLKQMNDNLSEEKKLDKEMLEAYSAILAISGNSNIYAEPFIARDAMPPGLEAVLENWNSLSLSEFPSAVGSLKTSNENLLGDNYISNIVLGHMASLSSQSNFSLNLSLKHVLLTVVSFISEILCWPLGIDKTCPTVRLTFVSLVLDSVCDHVAPAVTAAFKRIDPMWEQHAFKFDAPTPIGDTTYSHVLQNVWVLFSVSTKSASLISENVINGCGKILCRLLDTAQGKKSLNKFFEETTFADFLFAPFRCERIGSTDNTPSIPAAVMKFLVKILECFQKDSTDGTIISMCNALPLSLWVESGIKESWFISVLISGTNSSETSESWLFIKTLAEYTVMSQKNQEFGLKLLMAFVPLGTSLLEKEDGLTSLDHLVKIIYTLLYYIKNGEGHVIIFKAFIRWINKCKELLNKKNDDIALTTLSHLLPYLSDVIVVLKHQSNANKSYRSGTTSPPLESENPLDDSDWMDDIAQDDDDSGAEDSDEENISIKLCTFTLTQKEFMNQHWYHCHTCKMIDGVGVCTVCAKVCHRGHDMTYSKYGSFFCDCGAREDGTCQALVKRVSNPVNDGNNIASGSSAFSTSVAPSHSRQRPSSPQNKQTDSTTEASQKQRSFLSKALEDQRERLLAEINCSEIGSSILQLLSSLMPMIQEASLQNSAIGFYQKALNALDEVHTKTKIVTHSNDLMVATLGSQEGAFENVRLSYTGEQGQTIRQLLSNHMIHRVAMCVLSSPSSKRQHLAVSHEKGKITILQLSSLLKQHDPAKKKLTLTKLSSTPIPFTVLSINANPINDDLMAVCGVKDCHILTVSSSGVINEHLVLHPNLESGNYIIRCMWLPGRQTQLAIITADFIKIYDLSVDALSPQYYFQMPSGKIKDACFAIARDDDCHLVLMASSGYIYTQLLCEQSSAKHGPFFVFNVLSFSHPNMADINGEVGGGGISIYYSHTLQLLFFSYAQGQNFIAPLRDIAMEDELINWTEITLKGHVGSSNTTNSTPNVPTTQANGNSRSTSEGSNSSGTPSTNSKQNTIPQPLCQWAEVPGHPGLLTCMAQNGNWEGNNKGNSPVIIVVKTDEVVVHELKFAPSKSKMSDMVVLRHSWSSSQDIKTTLILLCEDGSLKIFNANPRTTDFWLSTLMQKEGIMAAFSPTRKKKASKLGRPTGAVSFPVDFFEHCVVMTDIEFGGNDLLQIYNVQQLRNRLASQGMYIASTKPLGFQLHARNNDPNLVICGIRVAIGSLHSSKAPTFVEIFGRTVPFTVSKRRWFDIPLTREESLQAEKKIILTFGPSTDPSGIIIVDSVKLYSKTKEDFGWPEEADEFNNSNSVASGGDPSASKVASTGRMLTTTDRLVSSGLEVLDGCFFIGLEGNFKWKETVDFATSLLNLPLPSTVQYHARCLLSSLHSSKINYHNHKDSSQLHKVIEGLVKLNKLDPKIIDCEAFHRLLITARNIAVSRPQNLVKYTQIYEQSELEAEINDQLDIYDKEMMKVTDGDPIPFLTQLVKTLWALQKARPLSSLLTQICQPGLTHVEASIHAVIEIIHAFTVVSAQSIPYAVKIYTEFLLCPDQAVSFSAKQALIKVLRPVTKKKSVYVHSPPRCSTPEISTEQKYETNNIETVEGAAAATPQLPLETNDFVSAAGFTFDSDISADQKNGSYDEPEGASATSPRLQLTTSEVAGYIPIADVAFNNDEFLNVLRSHGASSGSGAAGSLRQSLMGEMLDLHGDDEEAMVELAIALSLHDDNEPNLSNPQLQIHQNIEGLVGGLEGLRLQGIGNQVLQNLLAQSNNHDDAQQGQDQMNIDVDQADSGEVDDVVEPQEIEHFSDTTVSANGSDDDGEASTAATDGESNPIPSPAEHHGSGGSDSGGSVVESLGGGEHLSSMYINEEQGTSNRTEQPDKTVQSEQSEDDNFDHNSSLHTLRLSLLDALMLKIPMLKTVGGVRSIAFFQVILLLTSDMDGQDAKDKASLNSLLNMLVAQLCFSNWDLSASWERTPEKEVQLVIFRLLSVLMSRSKNCRSANDSNLVPFITANKLLKAQMLDNCLDLLKSLLDYWKNCGRDLQGGSVIGGSLLKPRPTTPAPDMSPFFLRQYVKGHSHDVFVSFPNLLTEMLLRLPYQIKKLGDGGQLDPAWSHFLCEYTMTQQTTVVRRQVRKLLLFICGHRDNYKQLRDVHALDYHMKDIRQLCSEGGYNLSANNNVISLPYDSLIKLMEHLKACLDIATTRTVNWQNYCLKDETVLTFMIEISYLLEEGVAPTVLQLLQSAICPVAKMNEISKTGSSSSACPSSSSAKRGSSEESEVDMKKEEANYLALVLQMNKYVDKNILSRFVSTFLLTSNYTSVRWQAHALILALYQYSSPRDQEHVLSLFWSLWSRLPSSGRKASQFVDLLGYFSLKTRQSEKKVLDEIDKAVGILRWQSQLLAQHPNASLYNSLSSLVEFDGYYLESEPCLVCNNPEIPFSSVKLVSVRVDSRFTTKTQVVKLVGSFMISRLTLRISDLKRTKMVRTLNIYYNNKIVQAIVELKNKPAMWNKAKKVQLSAGQTEVKIDFPLPIVACNLMFEYADFYENLQASTETLQCPRCSAAVPASPGVCTNCGENVYQCHKCRAINYDEKDPFLCNACGYCKYAKFDYALQCRPCCAVDPIENEGDRQKAVSNIDSLLERADRSYKQLQAYKPTLELFLVLIGEQDVDRSKEEGGHGSTQVNRAIHQLAQKYCGDCKASFDELSKIIQRIQAYRRELVNFDRSQKEGSKRLTSFPYKNVQGVKPTGKCYGCVAATTEHCITLFRALAINANLRQGLCQQGLIQDLLDYNLRRGTVQTKIEVRHLLCLLTKDDPEATDELNQLIKDRICVALQSQVTSTDLASAVRHEMSLLATSAKKEDSCWQQRLRCVMQIFLMAGGSLASPMVLEHVTLPCLRILQGIMSPAPPPPGFSRKSREKTPADPPAPIPVQSAISCIDIMEAATSSAKISIDLHKWLLEDPNFTFEAWRSRTMHSIKPPSDLNKMSKADVHERYLLEKYGSIWLAKTRWRRHDLKVSDKSWVKTVFFNPSSRMSRHLTGQLLGDISQTVARKKEILDLLTSFLPYVGEAGESAAEFITLYQILIEGKPWKQYLALKGVLPIITNLIMVEIQNMAALEETTFNIDLSQGYALKVLTELLASFVVVDEIKRTFKGRLLGTVLTGYLSLRKFIVQRTKLIDDTQNKFLDLLEDMTSGTEDETKEFMSVCVDTLKHYPADDVRTPVFIFERLCSIIYPEENDVGEFYLSLEKDPQQEDFLQGRMVGNPYSSQDAGFGPLMRDLKNKVCHDCELVALLEDDNGMELLVCNKIISLDLPVKEVYKKVWLPENSDNEAMRIVYRMRGLLGDATEEFVETLDKKKEDDVDDEKVYRMASVMGQCNGLKVMLKYLQRTADLSYTKPLLSVLLKLFQMCVKLSANREKLIDPQLGAVNVLLHTLKQCLAAEPEVVAGAAGDTSLTEQILLILEAILVEAAEKSTDQYGELIEMCGLEDIHLLLNYVATSSRTNAQVRERLMRVLPFLVFNNKEKMELLIGHFKPVLDFGKLDTSPSAEDQAKLEAFCVFCAGIEKNKIGKQLQEMIIRANIVKDALAHIEENIPQTKKFFVGEFFDDDWKEFITKPSLKYVLRILTGLATKDLKTQQAVARSCIPSIHRLEQISSDEHIGSLAENLLEALKDDPAIVQQVKETRRKTRQEKKQLAMKTRKKELEKLGLTANEKEQITSESSFLKEIDQLTEENGLVCAICLEGYRCQPLKVLAIYTFSKRCAYEEFESKSPKTIGHSTVSHFNVVHVDCHVAAVRVTHPRDEWERAALHNANTKANGLLPVWGPQVPESAFAASLARHNTYLQECTGHRDISYISTLHDLKLLIQRFSNEKSFSIDSGGGGPQSNMNFIPYMLHMALYVMNTSRTVGVELTRIESFFGTERELWVTAAFEVESPYFIGAVLLAVLSPAKWKEKRIQFLQRLLVTNHIRSICTKPPPGGKVADKNIQPWKVYKSATIFWAILNDLILLMFKKVLCEGDYSSNLAEYIRNQDQNLMEAASKMLSTYQNDLIMATSFEEFVDVVGVSMPNTSTFLSDLLQSLP